MPDLKKCRKCGVEIQSNAPFGHCPQCLLAVGFGPIPKAAFEDPDHPPPHSAIGEARNFGDYELLEEIARGGMGIVYKARQKSLDRIVAVKMILSGSRGNEEIVRRFKSEGLAVGRLQHPNIVAIHEFGVHDGRHFLVMDFVDGPNLSALVRNQPLPARRAAGYVKTISEAIHAAHERGVLHRDLKPSNILIDSQDQPRVTDFGLARHLDGESSLTQPGQMLGSPNYMPPEQAAALHQQVSRRSDVYGLGAILYHLLTGRPPFQGGTMAETIHQVLNKEPLPPRRLNAQVPIDLETICLKCLEKEPVHRYTDAQEVAEELGRFLRGEAIRARALRRSERASRWCRRNPVVASLTAVVVVAVVAGVAGWLQFKASRQRALTILYASDEFLIQQALSETNVSEARAILKGLESAIRRQPKNPRLWRARGVISETINELEEAYAYLSHAIELAEGDEKRELRNELLLRRSEVLKRMQRVPEAAMDYRRAKGLPYKHIPKEALPDFSGASTVSIEFGATNREQGLYVLEVGDSKPQVATRDGEEAWFFAPGANYAYFFVDPTFKWTLSNAIVRVEYQVDRGNTISLQYDGRQGPYSTPTYRSNRGWTGQWQAIEFILHDTLFRNTQMGGGDFRIHANEDGFYIRRITVSHHQRSRIPSRPPSTSSNLLDLTTYYNMGIRSYLPGADLAAITNVQQIIRDVTGIDFDARGLAGRSATNISINRCVGQIHFLQSARSAERDGRQIGSYVVQFSDSTRVELPLVYGRNIRAERGDYKSTPEAQVVRWSDKAGMAETPSTVQVFLLSWINPRPESEVKSVDFVSAGTRSAPLLLAITVEP